MKNTFTFLILILILNSCQIKEQADELKALQTCTYEIESADSLYIAGTNVNRFYTDGKLNLIEAPALAFAFMQQKIPVKGIINLKITNSGTTDAGINQFEYKVLLKDTELITGFINQKISVPANGGSAIVPVKIDMDIYSLLSNQGNQETVKAFLNTETEQYTDITFKIKPGFLLGTETIEYPDFIEVKKKISNIQVVNYLKGLTN